MGADLGTEIVSSSAVIEQAEVDIAVVVRVAMEIRVAIMDLVFIVVFLQKKLITVKPLGQSIFIVDTAKRLCIQL